MSNQRVFGAENTIKELIKNKGNKKVRYTLKGTEWVGNVGTKKAIKVNECHEITVNDAVEMIEDICIYDDRYFEDYDIKVNWTRGDLNVYCEI